MAEEKPSFYFGNLSLSQAIYSLTSSGWVVSIPLSRHQEYDLIGDNGNLQRIKVVSTRHQVPSGSFEANLRVYGGAYNKTSAKTKFFDATKCDYLYVMCIGHKAKSYLIPSKEIASKSRITLSKVFDDFIII